MTTVWRPTVLTIAPHTTPFGVNRVTSPYGNRPNPLDGGKTTIFHDGLDINNGKIGQQLVADADGFIVVAGTHGWPWSQPTNQFPSGNYGGVMVVIDHGSWCSIYAHMQPTLQVRKGDFVKLGDPVGTVGATGAASIGGAHLHYAHWMASVAKIMQLWSGTKPTRDPWTAISPQGTQPSGLSYEQKIRAKVIKLRSEKPQAALRWVRQARLTQDDDGQILTASMRLTAEAFALTEAPPEQ